MSEYLKLSSYLGERDLRDGRFAADALLDVFERRGIFASLLFRGSEGFGLKHHLQSDRLLTLSEDLPVVSLAVDRSERINAALGELLSLTRHGLFTLQPVRLPNGLPVSAKDEAGATGSSRLNVILGRGQRVEGSSAYHFATGLLAQLGLEGATVLLGVDGTTNGLRRRGRFFSLNSEVPLAVVGVGDNETVSRAVEKLSCHLPDSVMMLEDISLLKRDGRLLAAAGHFEEGEGKGSDKWCKLTVYADEQSRHDGFPLHPQIIRRLREAGALGATAIKGVWGYHGDHQPHGDSLRSIRRRVPVVAEVIDSPSRSRDWFRILDELTDEGGLITSELLPAIDSRAPGEQHGGLLLTAP